jgi:hypothetical protein
MLRRDLLIALSLANLCYLRIWSELLTYTRADTYLMKLPPPPVEYQAVMLNVLLVGAALWIAAAIARHWLTVPSRDPGLGSFRRQGAVVWFGEVAFLLLLLIPSNAVRAVLANRLDFLRSAIFGIVAPRTVELIAVVVAVLSALLILRFHRGLAHFAAVVLVALSPFCVVTFAQAIYKIARYDSSAFAGKPPAPPLPVAPNSPRMLWVIADEWDYRLTFVDRPSSLDLPEIDRLRKDSLFAERADPPGWETPVSMPGYFTGKLVDAVRYDGPSELDVHFRGAPQSEPWSQQPSVFMSARALGFNTALLDWYHPTCRVLSGLTHCEWWPMARQFGSVGNSFGEVLRNQTRSLFETTLLSAFGQSLASHQQALDYHAILHAGKAAANNPEYGLVVLHLPVPHAPHAYDRRTATFTLRNSPIRGYIDSLALLDRTVGELRRSMESSGEWDRTAVLFTSDHHYRESEALDGKDDLRIPYLLKLASQKEGAVYPERFNAVLTHDLVLAILNGELVTAADVARWLDANRARVQS